MSNELLDFYSAAAPGRRNTEYRQIANASTLAIILLDTSNIDKIWNQNQTNSIMPERNKITIMLAIGLILIAIPPLLFTGNLFLNTRFDLSHTGEIGDTIGGTTAPFIGLFGAILVYISFLKQVEANNILKEEIDRSNFFTTYNEITELLELTNTQFDKIRYDNKKGEEAFETWLNSKETKDLSDRSNRHFLRECYYVLQLVDKTGKSIEAFFDVNDIQTGLSQRQKQRRRLETSNSNFNFKNLLRLKFLHFYQLKYNATIIRLKNFTEAKEIEEFYSDISKFDLFVQTKKEEVKEIGVYQLFQKILIAINNIEITLKKTNIKFWGEKPIKNDN